jgi:hypothetical protein
MPATLGRGRPGSLILTAMIFASQTVFLVMAGIMAAAPVVALTELRAGRQEEPGESGTVPGSQAPHEEAGARP